MAEHDVDEHLPLKPVDFLVLLIHSEHDLHGYSIVREISECTEGRVQLVPGNFYAVLKRLIAAGLIGEADKKAATKLDDRRRRYYTITEVGKRVATAEAIRMKSLVQRPELENLIHNLT